MTKKIRLDELVVQTGIADNVDIARRLIMAGEIRTGDKVWEKAGEKVVTDIELELKTKRCRWVSRGGLKLEKAFKTFHLSANELRCIDIGASTGGFTDVLLHHGAREVYAVDVGYGLLDAKIMNDPRVFVKDRTNFRFIADNEYGDAFDMAVSDVSFISLRQILVKASAMLKDLGIMITLIKPQFEAEKHEVPGGGIVIDKMIHSRIINELQQFAAERSGLFLHNITSIDLVSKRKNIEFLALWKKSKNHLDNQTIVQIVENAHKSMK